MYQRWIIYVSALAIIGGANTVDAAYLIKLKNGNYYATPRYWREGNQVFFETSGGVFGVEQGFVLRIDEADQPIPLSFTNNRPLEKASGEATKETNKTEAHLGAETKMEKKREPGDPIVVEFNRLKNKSTEAAGMLTSELRDLLRQIKTFKDKISGDSQLFVNYGREFNDVHGISSEVEAILRSRTNNSASN